MIDSVDSVDSAHCRQPSSFLLLSTLSTLFSLTTLFPLTTLPTKGGDIDGR